MNNEEKKELIGIAIDLNNLLDQYIELHNSLMKSTKFSLRSIFKPIDFGTLYNSADDVLKQIDTLIDKTTKIEQALIDEKCEFLVVLKEYSASLRTTIYILVKILKKLFEKSQGSFEYSYREYNDDFNNYNLSITKYIEYGNVLNVKFSEFNKTAI